MSAPPRTLWLHGDDERIKLAVLGVVMGTVLRQDVTCPARADHRGSITIQAPMYHLGTGGELLWRVCHSLAGHGSVMLHELVANVDAESVQVVTHALNVLAGVSDEAAA